MRRRIWCAIIAAIGIAAGIALADVRELADRLRDFQWPALDRFNWALDYFDVIAKANTRPALHIVAESGSETGTPPLLREQPFQHQKPGWAQSWNPGSIAG